MNKISKNKHNQLLVRILLLTIYLSIHSICAQNHIVQRDTLCYIFVRETFENGRPVFTQCLIKNIGLLDSSLYSKNNFICNLYNYAIYVDEPFQAISKIKKYINPNEWKTKQKQLTHEIVKLLSDSNLRLYYHFKDQNSNEFDIYAVRLIGDFICLPIDGKLLRQSTASIAIDSGCYKHDQYMQILNVKKIIRIGKLVK